MTKYTLLYTEMITTWAIENGDTETLLSFSDVEHPIALQLGGCEAKSLAECARIAEGLGYDEVNLNVGCPSDRVSAGSFGAVLMKKPHLVAELVAEMRAAVSIPVTVKCRIGVDDNDSFSALSDFVRTVSESGCDRLIVHARKALLKGLSPKENRTVPALRPEWVFRIKEMFPEQAIEVNGEIKTWDQVKNALSYLDGAMIGRAAIDNPWLFSTADSVVFAKPDPVVSRMEVIEGMLPYIELRLAEGEHLRYFIKHLMPVFAGVRGAKLWRRELGEIASRDSSTLEDIKKATLTFRSDCP